MAKKLPSQSSLAGESREAAIDPYQTFVPDAACGHEELETAVCYSCRAIAPTACKRTFAARLRLRLQILDYGGASLRGRHELHYSRG